MKKFFVLVEGFFLFRDIDEVFFKYVMYIMNNDKCFCIIVFNNFFEYGEFLFLDDDI